MEILIILIIILITYAFATKSSSSNISKNIKNQQNEASITTSYHPNKNSHESKNLDLEKSKPKKPHIQNIKSQESKNHSLIITTTLAGMPHRFGKTVIPSNHLSTNEELRAVREASNRHDRNAIKLYNKENIFVGYVAKVDNTSVAHHLDNGGKISTKVKSINNSDIWKGVKLEICMKK